MTIKKARRALVILEGRDAAGKTTTAHDLVETLHGVVRVALPPPTDEQRIGWYFERWLSAFRHATEHDGHPIVVFDRSWYNRAGVERVMGFCSPREVESFFEEVSRVETDLVSSGDVALVKVFLTIDLAEQARRIEERGRHRPLTPVDQTALAHAADYTRAEEEMLARTSTPAAPWIVLPPTERVPRAAIVRTHILAVVDDRPDDTWPATLRSAPAPRGGESSDSQ